MYIATKALHHEDYVIIELIGMLDIWRIDVIEKTWPPMYCVVDSSLFFVTLCLCG